MSLHISFNFLHKTLYSKHTKTRITFLSVKNKLTNKRTYEYSTPHFIIVGSSNLNAIVENDDQKFLNFYDEFHTSTQIIWSVKIN